MKDTARFGLWLTLCTLNMYSLSGNIKPEVKVRRELGLHSLEDGILSGRLSSTSQRFRRGAAECCRDDACDIVLNSDTERADELRHKVESVRRH